MELRARCVREAAGPHDGERVLVTTFKPHGLAGDAFDQWERRLAPAAKLLFAWRNGWVTWREFAGEYLLQMRGQARLLREVGERACVHPVTLLCHCSDARHCHRSLLRQIVAVMFHARAEVATR